MKTLACAFLAGALFSVGLAVGGMTDPSKVIGFLDVGGAWDPSLMFVMGGALAVYTPAQWLLRKRSRPLFAPSFSPLSRARIDASLIGGSVLFGVGWGLSGYCPGPAITSLSTSHSEVALFAAAMFGGFALHDFVLRPRVAPAAPQTA